MSIPLRLAPFTGVYGLSFVFAMMAAALALAVAAAPAPRAALAGAHRRCWPCCRPCPPPERGRDTALLVQPNISETEEWTQSSLDRHASAAWRASPCAAPSSDPEQPPAIVVWPEVPAPLYYYEDPRFRGVRRRPGAHHPRLPADRRGGAHAGGAPLNSAVLISPGRHAGQPLRQGEPGALRRVRALALRRIREQDLHRGGRFRRRQAGGGFARRRPQDRRVHLLRIGLPELRAPVRRPAARKCCSTSPTTAGSARAPRAASICSIVRMRAAENRRWILRSTNDGITGAIDSAGRVRGTLPLNVAATSYTGFTYISRANRVYALRRLVPAGLRHACDSRPGCSAGKLIAESYSHGVCSPCGAPRRRWA